MAALALGAAPVSLPAQSPPRHVEASAKPAPSADDILKKAIARARRDDEQKVDTKYTYAQHSVVDELDSKDNVKKHEERVYQVFPIEGESYARLIQKDGRPLSAKEARAERDREQKFRQRVAEKKRRKQSGDKDDKDVDFNEELVSRYRFALTGRESVNGRPAYVLSFEPKGGDLPIKRRIDRLLNKLAGRLWIDEEDYEIARADAHLAENVSAWGGMLASVRKFLLRVEQTKVDETAWLPSYVDAYVDGRVLIKWFHMKIVQRNDEYRRIAPDGGPPVSSRP